MMVLDYTTIRLRLRWFAWPTLLSALLLGHFLASVGFWLYCLFLFFLNPYMRNDFLWLLPQCAPAFALCALAAGVFLSALYGRPIARRGVLFLVIATAAFFWTDVQFERYQISIDIATQEYWDSGGRAHEYFTWWWLNDRWLH